MSPRSRSSLFSTTCLCTVICALVGPARANPIDGTVTAGQATISSSANTLDIHQHTDKAVIDWRGFDIAPGETTAFHQPGSGSIALNRVNSNAASHIDGKLTANGNILILNQNGVMFGKNAQVDVNGIVASTADTDNDAFMNSNTLTLNKPGNPDAGIVNEGRITAKEAGLVGFVAPNVINSGVIEAKLGRVHLASGDTATVDLYGDDLMSVAVSDSVTSQLAANSGTIEANGGKIALTAAAGKSIVNSLVLAEGTLKAQSVGMKNGEIVISAEGSNAVRQNITQNKGKKQGKSTVLVSGTLDASGRNTGERGGKITVTGDDVALLAGTIIDASGHTGKSNTTEGKAISAVREDASGGDIRIGGDYLGLGETPTAKNLYVDQGAFIINDAVNTGDAGRSIFWSDDTTRFYGNVLARGGSLAGDGGFVETSGHNLLDANGYVDLTAANGKRGTYFLDPTNVTIFGNVTSVFNNTALSENL